MGRVTVELKKAAGAEAMLALLQETVRTIEAELAQEQRRDDEAA
jgi:hypothetical protein